MAFSPRINGTFDPNSSLLLNVLIINSHKQIIIIHEVHVKVRAGRTCRRQRHHADELVQALPPGISQAGPASQRQGPATQDRRIHRREILHRHYVTVQVSVVYKKIIHDN